MRLLAEQWAAPHLVVSHSAAAWLWDVELPHASAEFTALRRNLSRKRSGVRCLPLAETDVTVRRGLRCTKVDRTLGDLLRSAGQDEAVIGVESALTWRRIRTYRRAPLTTLDRVAAEAAQPRIHGRHQALQRLSLIDPHAASPAETLARLRMREAGLRPTSQAELTTPEGRRVRPDFLFTREGVVVEIEGYAYHGSREAHRRDLARFNDLQLCPQVRLVLRFTAGEVMHSPAQMITRIRHALARTPPTP
ncbi:hypothetical protein [Streptomyces sp. NPDC050264]|uniref:endonuclease domain-containing protein n=1 Tax=Streptomyces sp. NPDC050264 TaxID=3155038 RepID=UPI003449734E